MINGKLKRTLKEKCPLCGSYLQIRTKQLTFVKKGIDHFHNSDFKVCSNSNCDYEVEFSEKKNKKREFFLEE